MKFNLRKIGSLLLLVILASSCFFDEPSYSKPLVNDLKLEWWGHKKRQKITLGKNQSSFGGLMIIPETVFAVGYNDDFLIAKNYPNKEEEIHRRLFNYSKETGDFRITDPKDTIYLSSDDSIYQKNGTWYHFSNGWNPPNDLFPYKDSIYYHILDMRDWGDTQSWDDKHLFRFTSEEEFLKKKKELKIPEVIQFQIVYSEEN